MSHLQEVCQFLELLAPLRLAEDWDNVGLLVGDRQRTIHKIMACLTVTPTSAAEAIARDANLIVTHHPLPFRATKRITSDSTPGKLLWDLIGRGIAVYSAHTAFDSAAAGINQRLAEAIGLAQIEPLRPIADDPEALGSGRVGRLINPQSVLDVSQQLKTFLGIDQARLVGNDERLVSKVAVGCGSGGEFLAAAQRVGCDLFVTGETTFHTCLEAEATNVAMLLVGHFASERFAVEQLARQLSTEFRQLEVWASRDERDPLRSV